MARVVEKWSWIRTWDCSVVSSEVLVTDHVNGDQTEISWAETLCEIDCNLCV